MLRAFCLILESVRQEKRVLGESFVVSIWFVIYGIRRVYYNEQEVGFPAWAQATMSTYVIIMSTMYI